jgi:cholesterol transport system auxiliary component
MNCASPNDFAARIRNCLLLLVPLICSACMGNSRPPPPIYYYTLGYEAPAAALAPQLPCVLRVERFSASPPFNSQRIIYAHSGLQRNAYAYHQWIAAPGELLSYSLARDLRRCGGFQAVLTPDAAISATHSLNGWVEEFIEKDAAAVWQADATIHVTLVSNVERDPTRKILLQKRYNATAPCKAKTPEALAEAMSQVVGKISQAVIKDVYSRLSAAETLKY